LMTREGKMETQVGKLMDLAVGSFNGFAWTAIWTCICLTLGEVLSFGGSLAEDSECSCFDFLNKQIVTQTKLKSTN